MGGTPTLIQHAIITCATRQPNNFTRFSASRMHLALVYHNYSNIKIPWSEDGVKIKVTSSRG